MKTSMSLFSLVATSAMVIALSGCPQEQGATQCTREDGVKVDVDAEFLAEDGCNTCVCKVGGEIECTEETCGPGDGDVGDGDGDNGGDGDGDNGGDGDGDNGGDGDGDNGGDGDGDGGPCVDNDNDGFYTCIDPDYPDRPQEVDCDDNRWFVQPGGIEYPDNEIDDNCNDLIDDEDDIDCGCDPDGASGAGSIADAIDSCGDTLVSVSSSGDSGQFGVFADYHGDVVPKRGSCLAVMSSGNADGSNPTGEWFDSCESADPDPEGPADDNEICDLAQLRMTLRPPTNAKGFSFDFMFLSAEWPEFLCQFYNDTFYALVTSDAIGGGAQTNVSFDPNLRPITVNVGFFEQPREWTTPLYNTPYGAEESFGSGCANPSVENCVLPEYCETATDDDLAYEGSGSGWLTTSGPLAPGDEEIEIIFSIHDESDNSFDSSVIIDNFRWTPFEPPVVTCKEGSCD